MTIKELKLTNLRNFDKKELIFEKLTIICGENASGKSTIVEAIGFLSTGKSLRAEHDNEVIKFLKAHASIEGKIVNTQEESIKLQVTIARSDKSESAYKKQTKVNGIPRTVNTFAGNLTSVIFTPLDLELIIQGPSIRRKYLDNILIQTSKEYRHAHTNLVKATRQRNKVLEKINEEHKGMDELGFWNEMLIKESSSIHKHRSNFFEYIQNKLASYGKSLNNSDGALTYNYKQSLVTPERLKEYQEKEIASKNTLIGPQRDDFSLFWENLNLETYGSRGQQRTAILALKLCEIDYVTEKINQRPMLILDDIFSELDENHRKQIFDIVDLQQTIITTTDLKFINGDASKYKLIKL